LLEKKEGRIGIITLTLVVKGDVEVVLVVARDRVDEKVSVVEVLVQSSLSSSSQSESSRL
jgi:hypothetical protein